MLNLNSLYKAVFKPEYSRFDPLNDYYTILMDTPAFMSLYEEFYDRIEYLMSADAYTYLHTEADADLDRNTVEEKLSEIAEMLDMRTNSMHVSRRFCVLAYFDNDHQDVDDLMRRISWLNRDNRDVLTLLVCISKRIENRDALLEKLEEKLSDKANQVDLYLFTDGHTTYSRRALIHSICGAIVMNGDLAAYQARKSRKNLAAMTIGQYIANLGEDGKRYLADMRPIRWSSLHCKYYDRQYDFLNQYIADACDNVRKMSTEDFAGILDDIYRALLPHYDAAEVKLVLMDAFRQIPYVVAAEPRQQSLSTLRAHFISIYGENGVATVDLTLKATLSGVYNYRVEDLARKCSEQIFARCAGFAAEDLYELVCQMLERQMKSFAEGCDGIADSLRRILDDDMQAGYSESFEEDYLDKYLHYYQKQKVLVFWQEVRRLITTYPDNYSSYCSQSKDHHDQLAKLRESIPTNRIYQFEGLKSKSYTAAQLLSMEGDEASCEHIRTLFSTSRDEGKGIVAPADCGPVLSIPFAPHFYQSAPVELKTASYTMCGCELNGQYFVMMGAEQDV